MADSAANTASSSPAGSENKERLLEDMCGIIIKVFAQRNQVNCCFPVALILYEEFNRAGIGAEIVQGYGITLDYAFCHYWVEFEGKEYDLRRTLYQIFFPEFPPVTNHKSLPPNFSVDITEDDKTIAMYYKLIKATGNTQYYFNKAPKLLRNIKSAISSKIDKLVKN